MHIILFFLLFILAIVVFGLSIIGFILKALFGIGSSSSSKARQTYSRQNEQYKTNDYNSDDDNYYTDSKSGHKRKKIFSDDEGEYVDYEEVK